MYLLEFEQMRFNMQATLFQYHFFEPMHCSGRGGFGIKVCLVEIAWPKIRKCWVWRLSEGADLLPVPINPINPKSLTMLSVQALFTFPSEYKMCLKVRLVDSLTYPTLNSKP